MVNTTKYTSNAVGQRIIHFIHKGPNALMSDNIITQILQGVWTPDPDLMNPISQHVYEAHQHSWSKNPL
jgi:hypothetical protein